MKKVFLSAITAIALLSSCSSEKTSLSGAGATFPEPFYKMAFKQYTTNTGTAVTYGGIGSGGGVRSLKDKTVDFGASDVFLSDDELKDMGTEVVHIPTCIGGVVMAYNLKEVSALNMDADLVADIYLGKIKKWNDPKIQALNPGVALPDKAITPVYRSDGSGTTANFSEYMSKMNADWKSTIGQGKSLKFPVGVSAKGNTGVSGVIAETDGGFGYVGSEYALALNIPTAAMKNSSGKFIKANATSISAAANVDMPADTRTVITNSSNPDAYPISTFTWIIVYKDQAYNNRTEATAKALKELLKFILSDDGQAIAKQTNYAPLTGKALETAKAAIENITYNGKPLK